jgi:hypothetical protein
MKQHEAVRCTHQEVVTGTGLCLLGALRLIQVPGSAGV